MILIKLRTLISGADKLHWPMPVDYTSAPPERRREFESAFRNLLKLQELLVVLIHHSNHTDLYNRALEVRKQDPVHSDLYALQALVHPVALRFKYHFESDRQTNRLDKVGLLRVTTESYAHFEV